LDSTSQPSRTGNRPFTPFTFKVAIFIKDRVLLSVLSHHLEEVQMLPIDVQVI